MLFSNSVSYGFAHACDVGLSAPSLSASRPPSAVGVQEDDVALPSFKGQVPHVAKHRELRAVRQGRSAALR